MHDRIQDEVKIKSKDDMHLHLIGAGGIGMSGLRILLQKSGIPFTASDDLNAEASFMPESEPPLGADEVVVSSAIKSTHPQYAWAASQGTKITHRAVCTRKIIDDTKSKVISISGSHGKTTSSALLSWVLSPTSFLIGGYLAGTDICADLIEDNKYFVVEADESDGSMNILSGEITLLTNLSPEHIEHYGDFDKLIEAMNEFVDAAKICICHNSCKPLIRRREGVIFYDDSEAKVLQSGADGMTLEIEGPWGKFSDLKVGLVGQHMVNNLVGCLNILHLLGVSEQRIRDRLATFPGVKKRMEVINISRGRKVIQDYAHHPIEVDSLVRTVLQSYSDRPVHLLWEPHKFSRISYEDNYQRFLETMRLATGSVLLLPVWAAGEKPDPRFSQAQISQDLKCIPVNSVEQIAAWCSENFGDNHLLVAIGAGGVYKMAQKLIEKLEFKNN